MTNDQFAILQHQISAGRRYSGMDTDLSRHNEKLAEALTGALVERAELLAALNALRDELCGVDQWWGKLREAADAADTAISNAEGKS